MLTDEQIEEIAKPYKRPIGDHWSYETGMHEDNIDEFARDIEKAVLLNVRADIIAAISIMPDIPAKRLLEDTLKELSA